MTTGMLWLLPNNPKIPLGKKIQEAAAYYIKKYDQQPDLCLVHPSALEADPNANEIAGITVRPYRPVLPGHLWIGVEGKA